MPKGEDGFVESLNVGIRAPCRDKRAQPSPVAAGVGSHVDLRREQSCAECDYRSERQNLGSRLNRCPTWRDPLVAVAFRAMTDMSPTPQRLAAALIASSTLHAVDINQSPSLWLPSIGLRYTRINRKHWLISPMGEINQSFIRRYRR